MNEAGEMLTSTPTLLLQKRREHRKCKRFLINSRNAVFASFLLAETNEAIPKATFTTITWTEVTSASLYKVYSSYDPFTDFSEDNSGTFAGESWNAPVPNGKKFYYV